MHRLARRQVVIVRRAAGIARKEGETVAMAVVLDPFNREGDQESPRAHVALDEKAVLGPNI
jgi:hypothetical protein